MSEVATSAVPALSVHVESASLRYAGALLFDRLDFDLRGGGWTCLLGPSGVGKSSLLRLIAGLAPAEPGTTIRCGDGRPLAGRLAYMAQQDLLLPWLDVRRNVTLGHRLRGETLGAADQDRADDLLRRVGMAVQAGALPATLSGGMRQRAALARTLMEDRPVVLMDEPFSAVDAITRLALQDLAASLLAQRTVLLVTHDPLEALRLADRIYVMAGVPARLEAAAVPEGPPPRDVGDAGMLALQGELLHRLAAARAEIPNGASA